jgi:2-iminobutanoate/2-iminopropanoate deaminase
MTTDGGREELAVAGLAAPISHYTHAVRFGDLLFVSGLTAHDADGTLVGNDDPTAQTEKILANLGIVLAAAGATPRDVLKVTVYLTDIADRARINAAREAFFGDARPASTLVEVSALALPGMRVEIEAIVGLR